MFLLKVYLYVYLYKASCTLYFNVMFLLKVYVYHFTYRGEHSITHLKLVLFQTIVNQYP